MNIIPPQLPDNFVSVNDLRSYSQDMEDSPILQIKSCGERIERTNFSNIEIQESLFKSCTFYHCNFEKSSFIDVIFESCDFSNSSFAEAYFERCLFVSCKCVGVDLREAIIKNTTIKYSNFQYSNFDKAKMTDVFLDHADFTESSLSNVKLKRFQAENSKFIKTNFFKTMLATVDFTKNEFVSPIVSTPPDELRGAVVNMFQASDLISLWGVIVNQ